VIARVLLWSLFESKTTIDELLSQTPELPPPSSWVWNEASERFGLLAFGDDLPAELERVRDLIGHEPEVFEEFDVLD
jgi:hypothetical protein